MRFSNQALKGSKREHIKTTKNQCFLNLENNQESVNMTWLFERDDKWKPGTSRPVMSNIDKKLLESITTDRRTQKNNCKWWRFEIKTGNTVKCNGSFV